MHAGLRLLLRLRVRGFLRKLRRAFRDPRKAAFLIIAYGSSLAAPLIVLFAHMAQPDSEEFEVLNYIGEHMPVMFAALYFMLLIGPVFQFPVSFTPPEIQFLFSAPIGRASLLTYKLTTFLGVTVYLSLIFGTVLTGVAASWLNAVLGAFLFGAFLTLSAVAIGLLAQIRGTRLPILAALGAIALLAAQSAAPLVEAVRAVRSPEDWDAVVELARQTSVYRVSDVLMGPFVAVVIQPLTSGAFVIGLAIVLAANAAVFAGALAINVNYYELSLGLSARREAALSRMRQGKISAGAWRGGARIRVPSLPRLGGAGAVFHRHLVAALREKTVLWAVISFAILPAATGIVLQWRFNGENVVLVSRFMLGMAVYFIFIFSSMVRFDFRADFGVLDHLKTLPVHPTALAAGTLLAPTLFVSALEVLPAISFAVVTGVIAVSPIFLLFLVPLNLFWFAVDNAFYLRAPSPSLRGMSPDPSVMGREFISMLAKLALIGSVSGVAAGIYFGVRWGTGSMPLAILATWLFILPCVVWTVHLTGMAFRNLDLGRDKL